MSEKISTVRREISDGEQFPINGRETISCKKTVCAPRSVACFWRRIRMSGARTRKGDRSTE